MIKEVELQKRKFGQSVELLPTDPGSASAATRCRNHAHQGEMVHTHFLPGIRVLITVSA